MVMCKHQYILFSATKPALHTPSHNQLNDNHDHVGDDDHGHNDHVKDVTCVCCVCLWHGFLYKSRLTITMIVMLVMIITFMMMTRMIVISQVFCWLPKLLTHRSIWYDMIWDDDMILNSSCVVSSALVLSERPLRAAPCQCLLVPPHSPRLPLRSCSTPPLRLRDAHKYVYCWIVLLNPDAARPILPACHL